MYNRSQRVELIITRNVKIKAVLFSVQSLNNL